MSNFFENIDPDEAAEIDSLSKLAYEIRENKLTVLKAYAAEDEAALLQQIQDGAVAEHPAYEQYLAARILDDTREMVRALVSERLKKANQS
ncbi:MAG: hypothetical protein GZ085_04720 [Sulfuriferula multivorans]|uniref:Uncharacterized protein n=1 Tax=Sulfuriferula multivorans TaxID=1559896 RepID=A0A7C9KA83_9PROT|nr:hypothetical protein [Sulfuriferula multivorans]